MQLLLDKYLKSFICIFAISLLTSCAVGRVSNCSLYKFDSERQVWVDGSGQPSQCTIADNQNIFNYIPGSGQGCSYWENFYAGDPTAKFSELVVRMGVGHQRYCIKSHVFEEDSTGEILIVKGSLCFKETSKSSSGSPEFLFADCTGVTRAGPKSDE